MKIISRYSEKQKSRTVPKGQSLTQQSQANETDINIIMAKAIKTQQMPLPIHERVAQFGDFTQIDSYHTAQNKITHAMTEFLTLPAAMRAKFENDPSKLIQFLSDPDNLDEAVEMGLVEAPLVVLNDEPPKEPVKPTAETPTAPEPKSTTDSK